MPTGTPCRGFGHPTPASTGGGAAKIARVLRAVVAAAILAACVVLGPSSAAAQESLRTISADTSSPRDTLKTFIDACNEIHRRIQSQKYFDRGSPAQAELAHRILDCVDSSELPAYARDARAGEVAACIKEILDREQLPPWEEIPDMAAIEAAGGLEKLSQWRIPGTRLTITRVEEGPQRHEYLFSPGTVARAIDYYRRVASEPYRKTGPAVSEGLYKWYMSAPGDPALAAIVSRLPEEMQRGRTLGLANWKWPGLLIALLIAVSLMVACYRLQGSFTRRVRGKSPVKYCLTIVFPIAAMLVPLLFRHVVERHITVRGNPLYYISFFANVTALLAALVVIFSGSNRIAESIIASPRINPLGLNAQLIRIASRLTSLIVAVILFLIVGQYLGIPIATLLASAGIGGVALALGAQDTLKTLFGTLMLMADKPFRVGERIVFDKYDGVVEDIGLRSTKLRLLTGHQVTLPNNQLANADIENVGRRHYIRRVTDLHLPLDTPRTKIEKAVEIIRAALDNHDGMDADFPPRVFFNEFNDDSFNIRIIYWYNPPNYWDFLAFSEKLNFEVCRAFEEQGIQFSLPTRLTHTDIASRQQPLEMKMAGDEEPATRN